MGCGGWLATVIVAMAVEFVGGRLFCGEKNNRSEGEGLKYVGTVVGAAHIPHF